MTANIVMTIYILLRIIVPVLVLLVLGEILSRKDAIDLSEQS